MTSSRPPDVVGVSLDGATPYVISPDENHRLCATMDRLPDASGKAHPIYYHIATQVGMRVTIDGLCEICGFDMADGPMLGSTRVSFAAPLMTDQPYRVRGKITQIVRKSSNKFGVMDLVDYELRLLLPDATVVLVVVNTLVLPRRNAA